jgi:signal-transduction protein with cAMP-binding, CBS, and nucleotidyltransferase domain
MRVGDVITHPPVWIRLTSDLHHAAELVALSGVSDLMVVDEHNTFVGILSEGNTLRAVLPDLEEVRARGRSLVDAFAVFLQKGQALAHRPILPLVIREPIVLSPDDRVFAAAVILVDKMIRRLLVMAAGKLIGTLARADVCRAVVGTL